MEHNHKEGIQDKVNDLSFQIYLHLQFRQGSNWAAAIGYPQASSSRAAIKCWIFDHYESMEGLDKNEQVQLIIGEIKTLIDDYLNGEGYAELCLNA